jgi:hypothetical protein
MMDHDSELQRIKDAVAGEGSDRHISRKVVVMVASILAALIAVVFLGFLAIKIAAVPLLIIIFGVLGLMLYDLFDSLRGMIKGNGNQNSEPGGTVAGT